MFFSSSIHSICFTCDWCYFLLAIADFFCAVANLVLFVADDLHLTFIKTPDGPYAVGLKSFSKIILSDCNQHSESLSTFRIHISKFGAFF